MGEHKHTKYPMMKRLGLAVAGLLTVVCMLTGNLGLERIIGSFQAHSVYAGENDMQSKLTKVSISGQPNMHSLAVYIGKKMGWFEEEGLDASLSFYHNGEPQLEGIASTDWTVGMIGMPAGLTGIITRDLTCLGFSTSDDVRVWILGRDSSDIVQDGKGHIDGYEDIYGSPELWKGKTIYCTRGTMGHLVLLATLQALGLTEADVNVVHKNLEDSWKMFKSGEGDMICAWGTYVYSSDLESENYRVVSSARALKMYAPAILVGTQKAMEEPDVTQRIMNVLIRGIMWVPKHQEEAANYYQSLCMEVGDNISLDTAKVMVNQTETLTLDQYRQMFEDDEYSKVLATSVEYFISGGIWTQEDVETVKASFDGNFLEKALDNYEEKYLDE